MASGGIAIRKSSGSSKNGIRLRGMAAFGRVESEEHILDLVFYVRALSKATPEGR